MKKYFSFLLFFLLALPLIGGQSGQASSNPVEISKTATFTGAQTGSKYTVKYSYNAKTQRCSSEITVGGWTGPARVVQSGCGTYELKKYSATESRSDGSTIRHTITFYGTAIGMLPTYDGVMQRPGGLTATISEDLILIDVVTG